MEGRQFPRASSTDDNGGGFFSNPYTASDDSTQTSNPYAAALSSALNADGDGSTTASYTARITDIPAVSVTSYSASQTSALSSRSDSSSFNSNGGAGLATESQPTQSATSLPITQQQNDHDGGGLSTGGLAAAIVVPILVVLLLALGALFFHRRRKAQTARNRAGSGGSGATAILPLGLREKWGNLRTSSSSRSEYPEVMNSTNNAYYTGLDTSSHGSHSQEARRSENIDPPPPYIQRPSTAAVRNALPEVPRLRMDLGQWENYAVPIPNPRSPIQNNGFLAAAAASGDGDDRDMRPSLRSARSFTSTLYSDSASVHSARAARRSLGPNVIQPLASGTNASSRRPSDLEDEEEGPFADDANSPVSPLSMSDSA